MTHTKTEIMGFCEAVIDFVQTNKDALAQRGVNIEQVLAELRADATGAVNAGSGQETFKAKMRDITVQTNASFRKAYFSASSKVDMVAGMFGKTTEMGRQAAHLRSRIARTVRKTDDTVKNVA